MTPTPRADAKLPNPCYHCRCELVGPWTHCRGHRLCLPCASRVLKQVESSVNPRLPYCLCCKRILSGILDARP